MLKNIKNNNKGFTIIEVLIVLAIAGLIMLIVFLAVPALQRNSRNTQRKSDAGALLAAVQEYTSANGTAPSAVTLVGTNQWYFCATAPCSSTGGVPGKAGYYTTSSASAGATIVTTPGTDPTVDQIKIVKGYVCGTNGAVTAGNARSVVAWWKAEPDVLQCQES
jgi:prepilin-type N-terminal cleavage/methylation domain-containing protein